ncbi:hypothetical protein TIFTF001_038687 [Ficus carica]|uniref:Uncharacterized protein n=1 Tax=Ficus carica TaxID=3494 RepID=A0AA88E876_FICCA|nr:hypothetical protein TIFTF001_038687 [Ficus carica]
MSRFPYELSQRTCYLVVVAISMQLELAKSTQQSEASNHGAKLFNHKVIPSDHGDEQEKGVRRITPSYRKFG